MGGAVSSGQNNNELVDNLMTGNYIRTPNVERVFRALDRADYMSMEAREQAYKDLAWRRGPLHLSAPCIYSEVMEALELRPGLSFLNIGSGTGYLSTMVGLLIGSSGISHGVEHSLAVHEYATKTLAVFIENSIAIDEFDFCIPKFFVGNGLCLAPMQGYDRVYCGAGVLAKYSNYFKQFIRVGGILVMPLADELVQLRRVSATQWTQRNLLQVSFASLGEPSPHDQDCLVTLDEQSPPPLQVLARGAVRAAMRAGVLSREPALREPPRAPPRPRAAPRRICIPYDPASDEDLNELHDLDEADGAREMNALLSLVLSMGQNRAAGSLRLHQDDDEPAQEEEEEEESREDDLPADYIVFDVGARGNFRRRMRAPRPPPAPPAHPAPDSPPPDSPPPEGDTAQGSSEVDKSPESERESSAARAAAPREPARAPAPPRRGSAGPDRPHNFWSDLSSSEDDVAQVQNKKRQKLDSGIGEGTASSGASPDKSDDKSDDKTSPRTRSSNTDEDEDGDTDMAWAGKSESGSIGAGTSAGGGGGGEGAKSESEGGSGSEGGRERRTPAQEPHRRRRRIPLRSSRRLRKRAPWSESDSGAEESESSVGARMRRGEWATRRARYALAMKEACHALPLPHALKTYVNYGRSYQL